MFHLNNNLPQSDKPPKDSCQRSSLDHYHQEDTPLTNTSFKGLEGSRLGQSLVFQLAPMPMPQSFHWVAAND